MSKRIAIVGGGPNLAMATAHRFGREGWQVVLGARNPNRLQEQVAALDKDGIGAVAIAVDATDHQQVRHFVDSVERDHGAIDVLNYNAATIRNATLLETPPEAVVSDLMTDVGGAFYALQAVLPAMRERRRGTIILSGGGLAVDPLPDYLTLSVGKAGLRALGQAVARDPACADIHVAHALLHTTITPEAGREIADLFWRLAGEQPPAWRTEVAYPEHA